MGVLLKNNAASTLLNAIAVDAVELVVAAGEGANFPAVTGTDYFYVTVTDTTGAQEVMKVTGRTSDTLAITRAQDGTAASSFAANSLVEMRINVASVQDSITVASEGVTGGTGSAGAGNQYVEITIDGTTYRVLHDGTS